MARTACDAPRRAGVAALACLATLLALAPLASTVAAEPALSPLARALAFLNARQLRQPLDVSIGDRRVRDLPGNWPQHFRLRGSGARGVREVSPFMVAFIHHALALLVEANQARLGLRASDVAAARAMRRRAVGFIRRFESRPDAADADTFGFWPYDASPGVPGPLLELILVAWLEGPILGGERVPLNLTIYPSLLAIPSDADVTATSYGALLDDALLDGGPGFVAPVHELFVDWRDLGVVPRRLNPPWLPPASGAFLTWLAYRDPPAPLFPNDVDLVVNANVLHALGRLGRLDVPGVAEAVALINEAVRLGLHRDRFEEITDYYPDNHVFHYAVTRAYHEGAVDALAPAVQILADDLEASAIRSADGTVRWDRGAPQLNTAFAVLALLNAGRAGADAAGGAAFLAREQDARGGFAASPFFIARNDGGQVFEFYSEALTTAMALEAFARVALARTAVR